MKQAHLNLRLLIGILCLMSFLVLMVGVLTQQPFVGIMDQQGLMFLSQALTSTGSQLAKGISLFGSPEMNLFLVMCISAWLAYRHDMMQLVNFLIPFITGVSFAYVIKFIVQRPRPSIPVFPVTGFSFPSGHTVTTTLLVVLVLQLILPYLKPWQKMAGILSGSLWIGAVGLSRVYLRAHYPSDVLAGLLLALGVWLVSSVLLDLLRKHGVSLS